MIPTKIDIIIKTTKGPKKRKKKKQTKYECERVWYANKSLN